jgi:hypothetical protein
MASSILFFGFLALSFIHALASDPGSLQDFCVADETPNGTYKLLKIYKTLLLFKHLRGMVIVLMACL